MVFVTEDHRQLARRAEELAREEFTDKAFTWDGDVPWENIRTLVDEDLYAVNIPTEYGGLGMSEVAALVLIEAVGRVCPTTADFIYRQHLIGPRSVERFGTDAAQKKYLPQVANGESSIAIAGPEPGAGSDPYAMETTVEEGDEGFVIDGEKIWTMNVRASDACVVWARFPQGLGSVVVDLDAPGVEIEREYTNAAGFSQFHYKLNDVWIPRENLLTRGPDEFKEQLYALNWERLGSAALSNAMGLYALDTVLEIAQERDIFASQGRRWMLADMYKKLWASRSMTYQTARLAATDDNRPNRLRTSATKLQSSETVEEVVSEALQFAGMEGYMQGHTLERLYRQARGRRIAAGSDEVQKDSIASALEEKGLPPLFGR